MGISCDSVLNIHWRSKHVKYNEVVNVTDTTARHAGSSTYSGSVVRPVNKFN